MDRYAHRKSSCRIRLVEGDGTPFANRPVTVELKKHEFKFGTNVFWLTEMFNPAVKPEKKALLEKVWESWSAMFNFGTMSFYQGRYEPQEGLTLEAETLRAAKFLKEHNVTLKGHPLCWHTASAKWLLGRDEEAVLENQLHRIRREVTAFKDYIHMWDVINEVVIMPVFEKEDNAITRLCQKLGRVGLVKAVFDMARQTNPDATLLLNDFNTSEKYAELISDCLEAGVPMDVIGIQSHQHQGFWGMEKLHEVLERFEKFGLPMHFTENTFVSGSLMPPHIVDLNDWQVPEWPTTPEGEDRQARDMLAMADTLFAHPQVEAFINWDFCDGAWLGAPAGLVRLDGSHKPAYDALKQRITQDWHTKLTLHTDADGWCDVTGFRGEYEVVVDGLMGTFTLDKTGGDKTVLPCWLVL